MRMLDVGRVLSEGGVGTGCVIDVAAVIGVAAIVAIVTSILQALQWREHKPSIASWQPCCISSRKAGWGRGYTCHSEGKSLLPLRALLEPKRGM